LKLGLLLEKLKEHWYNSYISTKITISKNDLADIDKVKLILKKARRFYQENYDEA
jgi:hypothetical protein